MRPSIALLLVTAIGCQPGVDSATLETFEALEPGSYDATTLLVGLDGELPQRLRAGEVGLDRTRAWAALEVGAYAVPTGADLAQTAAALASQRGVRFVEPNLLRQASVSDPFYSYQWNLAAIDVEGAWATGDGSGAVVAVIDTGLSSAGEDTPAWAGGWDFVGGDSDPNDENGHGTHVAGTIAQATDNALGVAGIAYGATIMPVRVLDASGSGTSADVIDGIVYAADHGADVINMSLGSAYGSTAEATAVTYAWNQGVTMACAAGNSRARRVDYPARYPETIAVGATDYRNQKASYSSYGTGLDLMAPGGDTARDDNGDGYADGILQETFDPDWGYFFWQGTSMATPHVAAVAAILSGLGASNVEVKDTLLATTVDLGKSGYDSTFGYGLLDAAAAVAAWAPVDTGDTGTVDTGDTGTVDTGDTGTPADTTPPVISGLSYSMKGKNLKVTFSTDEPATGQACDDGGACGTSVLGTSHTITFRPSGTLLTVTATDAAGNSTVEGPYSF
ncbi:MAG: S8 family peptidase [Pseudomonadota bacterium]